MKKRIILEVTVILKMEIITYNEDWAQAWDNFLPKALNSTFLHSRAFYKHNAQNALDDASFLFLKKGKIIGLLPAILYSKNEQKILHSHLRSTYGGFVVNADVGVAEAVEMVDLLLEEAKKLQINEIIVRNPFRIFNKDFSDETDYALWYRGFALKSREIEIAIDLRGNLEQIRAKYQNGAKYNIKKALKFVHTKISENYEDFWIMLTLNLQNKHKTKPVHSLENFMYLRQLVGQENIKLFTGWVEGQLACGVVVFLFEKVAIHAQYIASDEAYQHIRPLNAVLDYIIAWGHAQGYQYFNLGTANEAQGSIINTGLFHFKEGFGGRGVLRETMHKFL